MKMHGVFNLLKCFKPIHSTTTSSKHKTKPPEKELVDSSEDEEDEDDEDDEDDKEDEDDEDNGDVTYYYDILQT